MLQNALHQALPAAILRLDSAAVALISQADIGTHSGSIPLHLDVPGPGLTYTSAVAHAVAALGPWPPMAVAQALQTTLASMSLVAPPLQVALVPQVKGEGWLQYCLTAAELASWLEAVYKAPPEPALQHQWPLPLPCDSSPLAKKLHLSELALLQHSHASCWRLLRQGHQMGGLDDLAPMETSGRWPAIALPPLPSPPQPLPPVAQGVLHRLSRLVDTLATADPNRHRGRHGLYLAEQLYDWEATAWQWPQAPSAQRHYYLGMVAASQRSLQRLLDQAGLPAPRSL
ncbi:hypothetical protein [Halomicronema hongdechloris]|nr:hypothetical protein [Halomicronema hongdechloris]